MLRKRFNLSVWLIVIAMAFLIIVNVAFGYLFVDHSRNTLIEVTSDRMQELSMTITSLIDGDLFDGVTGPGDMTGPEYDRISDLMRKFMSNTEINYVYVVRYQAEKEYIFILDPDPEEPAQFGETLSYTPTLDKANAGTPAVDTDIVSDRWGSFYSAFTPLRNSAGNIVAIVGVDFDSHIYEREETVQIRIITTMSVVSLLVGALIMLAAAVMIRRRFDTIYKDIDILRDYIEQLNEEMISSSLRRSETGRKEELPHAGDVVDNLTVMLTAMKDELKEFVDRLRAQAYMDPMTGVRNKTAYLELLPQLDEQIRNGTARFAVAVFDINGLKKTNDSYGHGIGDRMIENTADVFVRVFGYERLFRIGGDEFIAVWTDVDLAFIEERMKQLVVETEKCNATSGPDDLPVSFASGYAVYDKATDRKYNDVFARADRMMYDNKNKFYEGKRNHRS